MTPPRENFAIWYVSGGGTAETPLVVTAHLAHEDTDPNGNPILVLIDYSEADPGRLVWIRTLHGVLAYKAEPTNTGAFVVSMWQPPADANYMPDREDEEGSG